MVIVINARNSFLIAFSTPNPLPPTRDRIATATIRVPNQIPRLVAGIVYAAISKKKKTG